MKKVGRYLLTVVPVILGLAIQVLCSFAGAAIYGFFYGRKAAMSGEVVSTAEVTAGYAGVIIYILILSQLIAFLVFGIWYRKQSKTKVHRSITKIIHGKTIGCVVVLGAGLQILTNMALQIAYIFVPEAIENMSELMEQAGIGEMNVFSMAATVILAPVVEEIIFRGVTLNLAKKAGASFVVANVIQAVMFGVYHGNWVQGVYAGVLGLVLGYVAQKYGSLYPSILLHLAYNLAATLLSAVSASLPETIMTQIILAVAAFILVILGICLFKADSKEEAQEIVESQSVQSEGM